jgi:DNA-binding CsgD family transcriptional regulator
MPRLGERDLRGLLSFLGDLYAVGSLDAFTRQVNSGLRRLVPHDINGYNEINARARRIRYVVDPAGVDFADGQEVFGQHMHEHPIIRHYRRAGRDPRPVLKLSDFLSQRQLHDLGLYTDFFRRMRIERLIVVPLPFRPPVQVGFSPCRSGRDFTERDRLVLDLLRPHLAQAYRNAEAMEEAAATAHWLEEGLARSARGLIALGPDGRVRRMTERARRWLAEYWNSPVRRGNGLPLPLRDWVRGQHAGAERLSRPRTPLRIERDGKCLVVRLVSDGAAALLLLEEQRLEPDIPGLETLGLSRREAEVLAWVAQGKTNPEIASIAGLSGRTVGKHLERVYAKLGVETRTAAARIALSAPRE